MAQKAVFARLSLGHDRSSSRSQASRAGAVCVDQQSGLVCSGCKISMWGRSMSRGESMKALFRAWLLTLLFCVLLPHRTSACDCAHSGPCKAFANTPAVFTGRVAKIATINLKAPSGDLYEDRLILLEVDRS